MRWRPSTPGFASTARTCPRPAREIGYVLARLDTGTQQPRGQHLYESAGYRAIANFNANPVASFWGEKTL
jgi:hypothetical protein